MQTERGQGSSGDPAHLTIFFCKQHHYVATAAELLSSLCAWRRRLVAKTKALELPHFTSLSFKFLGEFACPLQAKLACMLRLHHNVAYNCHVFEVQQFRARPLATVDAWAVICVSAAIVMSHSQRWALAVLAWLAAAAAAYISASSIKNERLTVMPGMGVTLASFTRWGFKAQERFVDLKHISSVLINEGLTTRNVHFYMAFELRSGRLEVAFPNLLPHLQLLRPIYKEVHDLMIEDIRLHGSCQAAVTQMQAGQ